MKLRKLSSSGIAQFTDYLAQLKIEPSLEPPKFLLTEAVSSEELLTHAVVTDQVFPTRLAAAQYLDNVLRLSGLPQVERDVGLWAWLTLFYFDKVCPAAKNGLRTPGETARYVPAINVARRYYRHMLLGPFLMYRIHSDNPDRLLALLSSEVRVGTSETYRLFIENPTLLACNAVVATASWLYFDKRTGRVKRGASKKDGGGHCRRLIEFLQQIDCTFDLPMLTEDRLRQLLPNEFKKFFPAQLELTS